MTQGAGSVDLGSAYGRVEIDWSQIEAQMNRAFETIERQAGNHLDSISQKLQGWGNNISSTGQTWTLLLAPLAALEAAGIRTYGTFEDVLAEIQARTGATGDEMALVSQYALQMGTDTAYSGTQAAEAMLQLLSSGYNLEQTFAALPAVLNAAAAGGMDLGYAADVVTDALAMWGLQATDAGRVADALSRGASASSAEINDLAMGLGNVGPLAAEMGLSLEDTVAILAAFSERGIKGAEAGTQLKSMLNHMLSDTPEVAAKWDELGISMFDATGQARPLGDVLGDLREQLVGMTDEQRIQTLQTLAGTYGELGLSILTSDDAMGEMLALMDQQADAATVAEARMNTLNGRIDTMRGSIETAMINALKPFIEETLKPGIETVTEFINRLNEWILANPELVTQIVELVSQLILVGPALIGIGKAISTFGKLIGGLGSPIGWLILAAVLLYEAWTHNWFGIRDIVAEVIDTITGIIEGSNLPEIFDTMMAAFGEGDFSGVLSAVGDLFQEIYRLIEEQMPAIQAKLMEWAQAFIDWVVPLIPPLLEALLEIAESVLAWIGQMAPVVLAQLAAWGLAFLEWIAPMIPPLLAKLAELAGALWDWIVQQAPGFISQLLAWGQAFVEWIAPYIPPMLAALAGLLQSLIDWIVQQAPVVLDQLVAWANAFIDWIAPQIPGIVAELETLLAAMVAWIGEKVPIILYQLAEWAGAFIQWIAPMIGDLLLELPEILAAILKWVMAVLPDILAALLKWGTAFIKWIGPMIPPLLRALGEMLGALLNWIITEAIPAIAREMPGLADALLEFSDELIDKVGPALGDFIDAVLDFGNNELLPALKDMGEDIAAGIIDGISEGLEYLGGKIKDAAEGVINDMVDGVKDLLGIHSPSTVFMELGRDVIRGFVDGINNLANDVLNVINGVFGSGVRTLIDIVSSIWNAISPSLQSLYDWFMTSGLPFIRGAFSTFKVNVVEPLIDTFATLWDTIAPALQAFFDWFMTSGLPFIGGAFSTFKINVVEPLIDTFVTLWTTVSPALQAFYDWFMTDGLPFIRAAFSTFKINVVDPLIDTLAALWNTISPALQSLYDWFMTSGLPFIRAAFSTFKINVVEPLITTLSNLWSSVQPGVEAFKNGITAVIDALKNDVINPFTDAIREISNAWADVKNGLGSAYDSTIGRLGFASGGYTGDGPANEVAGVVHGQEWVIPTQGGPVVFAGGLMAAVGQMSAQINSLLDSLAPMQPVGAMAFSPAGGRMGGTTTTTNTYSISVTVPSEKLPDGAPVDVLARELGAEVMGEMQRRGLVPA